MAVFRQLLTSSEKTGSVRDDGPHEKLTNESEANEPENASDSEWYEIEQITGHRRYRGKDLYRVKWKHEDKQDWVDRSNVTDYAIQCYYRDKPKRRRRRRSW